MGNCVFGEKASETLKDPEEELSAKQYASKSLHSVAIFSKLQEEDLEGLEEIRFEAGAPIVVEGDSNTDLIYILRSGACEVTKDGAVINNLGRGSVIGERAFIAQKSRSATVTAVEHCSVLAIKRSSLEKALGFDSFVPADRSAEEVLAEKLVRLGQFPLLASMPDDYLKEMAKDMMILQYLPTEPIIIKGSIGKEFYFIDRGSVDIVDGGPEANGNPTSPSGISFSLSSASPGSVKSSSSKVSSPSSTLNFNEPVKGKPASAQESVPLINFDGKQSDDGETSEKGTPSVSAASSPARNKKDGAGVAKDEEENPLHDENAEIINAGINDFLHHYETARMKSLGGLISDLKKGTGNQKGGKKKVHQQNSGSDAALVKTTEWGDVKATLRAGQFFGEMALMEENGEGRRTATCLARTHCTLLAMKKAPFLRLMDILNGNA